MHPFHADPKIRVANKDDKIPLATPIKDKNGKLLSEVRIRKGQIVSCT